MFLLTFLAGGLIIGSNLGIGVVTGDSQKTASVTGNTSRAGYFTTLSPTQEGLIYSRPAPTNKPAFLKDTLDIDLRARDTYWKFPNQSDYSSWLPRIAFELFYDDSARLRFTAEWFNPDGLPWFSESLNYVYTGINTARMTSDYSNELLNTKAVVTTGTYGLKLTNSKTNEVVFHGKFKVNKKAAIPGDVRNKNRFEFFVDNDWNLPVGYVGFKYDSTWDYLQPTVMMWFKGRLETKDFEARLFHNGQEILSTDEGGNVNMSQERGADCLRFVDVCQLHLWEFYWPKFMVENSDWVRSRKPNSIFTKDKPGDYTVKVFHKGVQVRETQFTIDATGRIAPNAFSDKISLTNFKIVVLVKVTGTLDKWNPATWKTDAFYGNPLPGFGQ
jgi:hypothetical protein